MADLPVPLAWPGVQDGLINRQGRDVMTIVRTEELRLGMLRHWSLYDSMRFTSYISARMQVCVCVCVCARGQASGRQASTLTAQLVGGKAACSAFIDKL